MKGYLREIYATVKTQRRISFERIAMRGLDRYTAILTLDVRECGTEMSDQTLQTACFPILSQVRCQESGRVWVIYTGIDTDRTGRHFGARI